MARFSLGSARCFRKDFDCLMPTSPAGCRAKAGAPSPPGSALLPLLRRLAGQFPPFLFRIGAIPKVVPPPHQGAKECGDVFYDVARILVGQLRVVIGLPDVDRFIDELARIARLRAAARDIADILDRNALRPMRMVSPRRHIISPSGERAAGARVRDGRIQSKVSAAREQSYSSGHVCRRWTRQKISSWTQMTTRPTNQLVTFLA